MADDTQAKDAVRRASELLVGRRYRLEIAAAIFEIGSDDFTSTSLSASTGIRYPRVQEDLKRLCTAGLLTQRTEGAETRYNARRSAYWAACSALLDEAVGEQAGSR